MGTFKQQDRIYAQAFRRFEGDPTMTLPTTWLQVEVERAAFEWAAISWLSTPVVKFKALSSRLSRDGAISGEDATKAFDECFPGRTGAGTSADS